ncbi:hypothetical protein SN13T_4071 (plasmid) [Lactiplantibacillus plantarum]|nr:hypothetical protein SN13T_4071 [Lactiplantibacillus plantarum]
MTSMTNTLTPNRKGYEYIGSILDNGPYLLKWESNFFKEKGVKTMIKKGITRVIIKVMNSWSSIFSTLPG